MFMPQYWGGELASVVLKFAWPVIGGYLGQIMGIPSSDGAFFFQLPCHHGILYRPKCVDISVMGD